ncbi:MAG: hypothetical protein JOZ80_18590 [Acidobacteriaceae bacterium]|nr:hypothetical protein [Acidobacteriaceae bacterium]
MPKRSRSESGTGGSASSHRGSAGHAGSGAQRGDGNSKNAAAGRKKSTSDPRK